MLALLLSAAALNFSCTKVDNAAEVVDDGLTTIELDGQKYRVGSVATLTGTPGTELSLTLGVYDRYDIYGVDFGDGVIVTDTVCFENGGLRDEEGLSVEGTTHQSATIFKGTVAGEGRILIYGQSDLWMLGISGEAMPTSFTEEKVKNISNLSISGANIESLDLNGLESLKSLNVSNTPLRSINLAGNPELTSLSIVCTSISAYEPQLTSIDLSKNTKLTSVTLGSSFYKQGQLTSIDLSANTALETIVVSNNKLTTAKLPAGADVNQLSLDNNQLTSVDLSVLGSLKNIQINNNQLTSIDLSKMVAASRNNVYVSNNLLEELTIPVAAYNLEAQNNKLKSVSIVDASYSCKLENNQLTLATLPAKPAGLSSSAKTKRFTYAPQAALEVPAEVAELDLSAQLTAVGIEAEAKTTAYSFVTASGTELAEGTDYEVTAPGKFKFVKAQEEKVHGVMTNEALPLFTGDNAFVTTEFTVK
ncbi:MAG: hypothetical protein IJ868_06725 [Prevotella sp.]|nr:hypothetical protein [Prevotella sp.]